MGSLISASRIPCSLLCGTSLADMISAGGGLVVRLEDPSLNACLITELAGAEHIVSAEEDMRMTIQG